MAVTRLQDYGSEGLIGVLTPQANTTVEPEFWALLPAGWSMLNARLTSSLGTIEERLVDYTKKFGTTADRFANAPIEAIAAACTGASYLIGADEEARIVAEMQDRRGVPFHTAALSSVAALRTMKANRIALLTPYPESLNSASKPYWQSHGFEVVASSGPDLETDAFHPIYAMSAAGVLKAYERLSDAGPDAILMLGTGMATLGPILAGRRKGLVPAVSCNLALAWAATGAVLTEEQRDAGLADWLTGSHWSERLGVLFPDPATNL